VLYSYSMTQSEAKNPRLLTLKQACDMLNCHPNTLRAWDGKGYLVAVRLGTRGDRRYKKADVIKLMETKPKKADSK
jgi:excisionase family DNA binding protein